jgi:lipopolysaccharide transport system ATP-binding protein
MAAVKTLCSNALILINGKLIYNGETNNAIKTYLTLDNEGGANRKLFGSNYQNTVFELKEIYLRNVENSYLDPLVSAMEIELVTKISFYVEDALKYQLTYHLYNELGENMFSFSSSEMEKNIHVGENEIICKFPKNFFQSGNFNLAIFIVKDKRFSVFSEKDILTFTVVDGERKIGEYMGREPGYIKPKFNWVNI